MVRMSNSLLGILNILTFLISIPMIFLGLIVSRIAKESHTECGQLFEKPIFVFGVFLLVVSMLGFVGACCKVAWLLYLYLVVMFLLIAFFFSFLIFGFVDTNKGAGEAISGKGYKEYRLGDYSTWLQKKVTDPKYWSTIQSCIQGSTVCKSLMSANMSAAAFNDQSLLALQSGCCKPSIDCNFGYLAPTIWARTSASSFANPDCSAWSNDPKILCYNCQSCKAGVLENMKNDWKRMAKWNIIALVALNIIYSVGCCAFRNIREENAWKRYP